MARLTSDALDALTQAAVTALSAMREPIDVSHQAVRAAIGTIDQELESAETAILAAVAAGTRTWLVAHPKISRELVSWVEEKRKAAL